MTHTFTPQAIRISTLLLALVFSLSAQSVSSVDPAFAPVPSSAIPQTVTSLQQTVQADNKVLVWGGSLAADGVALGQVGRLDVDGSVDSGFSFCSCGVDYVTNVAPLANGKILVGGSTGNVAAVIRLNYDGSLDPSFNYVNPPNNFGSSSAAIVAVHPDGRFFATRTGSSQGFSELVVFHFNADGSVDSAFSPISIGAGSPNFTSLSALRILPDERFYIAQTTNAPFSTSTTLRRFTPTGQADSQWEVPIFASGGFPSGASISGIDIQNDGKIVVTGNFDTVNGIAKVDIVRLMPAGNVDLGFTGPAYISGNNVKVLGSGKILYSARTDVSGISKLFRLNSDGTADTTFVMDPNVPTIRNVWVVDSTNRIIFLGPDQLVRLLPDGALDSSFTPNLSFFGTVESLASQADGKVILAGRFSQVNGVVRAGIARVDSAGALDASFDPGTGFDTVPKKLAVQADGKILAVGTFTSYNGTPRSAIARLNSDGSLDATFTPAASNLFGVLPLADGRILINGNFNSVNGVSRAGIAILNSDGSLDPFNPLVGGNVINAVRLQSDGKLVIGGSFNGVDGFSRPNLARLNSNGSIDQSFNAGSIGSVSGVWLQADGKYVITSGVSILRRTNSGAADPTFTAPTFNSFSSSDTSIDSISPQPDGSLIVGGKFDYVGNTVRQNFTRLGPDGRHDVLFMPAGASDRVRSMIELPGGKLLIGGDFVRVQRSVRAGIARIALAPFRRPAKFDFDGDGRADVSVFRASTNRWYILRSSDFGVSEFDFGLNADIPAPEDWDGDGKTDLAVFRPSTGTWWYRSSSTGGHLSTQFGAASDVPRPGDYNGDGRIDYVVYRPSESRWYLNTGTIQQVQFGAAGDKAVSGDFDRDGKNDVAIYRPSTGTWWYASSANGGQHRAVQWGIAEDIPAPADFDGDGFTDLAVYRPSTRIWYIWNSSNGTYTIVNFGLSEDRPVPADYDGDGKADIAVFRPSTGIWYILQSTSGFTAYQFGISSDVALPGSFVP